MFSHSLYIYSFLFNWYCAVTDFYSIFMVLCWVFFINDNTNNNNNESLFNLPDIGIIWIFKFFIFTIFPVLQYCYLASIMLFLDEIKNGSYFTTIKDSNKYCYYIILILVYIGLFIAANIVCCFICVALEIFCYIIIAFVVYSYGEKNIARHFKQNKYLELFEWFQINQFNKNILDIKYTIASYLYLKHYGWNDPLKKYLIHNIDGTNKIFNNNDYDKDNKNGNNLNINNNNNEEKEEKKEEEKEELIII